MGELEYLHTYRKAGGGAEVMRDMSISSRALWETGSPERYGHPAAMPLDLAAAALTIYTDPGDVVAEPFAGSGTTLIACEVAGRLCIAAEVAPRYCDVTVRRWQDMTGKTAILEATGEPFAGD